LRYYEQIGLIPPPERIGAQRLPAVDCPPIALIRMAQQAGLPLADIRALFAGATLAPQQHAAGVPWPSASCPRSTRRSSNSASYAASSRTAWNAGA